MTTLITRLLADPEAASEASAALQSRGFAEEAVGVVSGAEADARAAMAEMGVGDEAASAYAGGIAEGNALVAVRAPFGMAGSAVMTLKKFKPVDVGVENEDVHVEVRDDPNYATPSIIPGNRKFLTAGGAVARSRGPVLPFGGLLAKNQRGKAKVGTSTISSKFGWATIKKPRRKNNLTRKRTPLSNLLGLATIKKPRGGKSVIDNPTPFSSALGWPTLIEPKPATRTPDGAE